MKTINREKNKFKIMTNKFDGKKIREEVLEELKSKIETMERKPSLAVFCLGDNPVCSKYVGLKKKIADKIGVNFYDYSFDINNTQKEIVAKIKALNEDNAIDGIMVQMPIPEKFDKFEIVNAISQEKDVDGLRFCCGCKSSFKPPVVLAILKAISEATASNTKSEIRNPNQILDSKYQIQNADNFIEDKKIVIIGEGFLVGGPLKCHFKGQGIEMKSVNNIDNNAIKQLKSADIIISAVGKANIITPKMVKEGVILIDAGTTEVSGELRGDIDSACYEKASYYTPVPGGIGPVTVAMLFKNLLLSEDN